MLEGRIGDHDPDPIGRLHRLLLRGVFHQQQELFATIAADVFRLPTVIGEQLAEAFQQFVARQVAVGVVVVLEVVDIQQEDRELGRGVLRRDELYEALVDVRLVDQAGEAVGLRQQLLAAEDHRARDGDGRDQGDRAADLARMRERPRRGPDQDDAQRAIATHNRCVQIAGAVEDRPTSVTGLPGFLSAKTASS